MPRIDPTAHDALYRLQCEEQRQAQDLLSRTRLSRSRQRRNGAHTSEMLVEVKRLIEAIEKLM